MNKKVMVGMSGGVDSSVAAKILLDSGYDVTGVTLRMFSDEDIASNIEDARSVADRLGFEHMTFNFKDRFRECVMKYFSESYLCGKTPNPCIECNRHIKFDLMLSEALALGYDYIATGHYAIREFDKKLGRYLIKRPKDRSKEQTYVLYSLTQQQLEHTLFPLGEYEKCDVRKIAETAGLINSKKPDSQDICFVPDGNYAGFIKKFSGAEIKEGNFIDSKGNILGKHKGIIHYTVGQRKGLGIALGKPVFVLRKNPDDNTVTLGDESELYTNELFADNVNLISCERITGRIRVWAKTRYNQTEQPAFAEQLEDGRIRLVFDNPQRAVTSGQAAVFYDGDIVIGGGTII